MLRLTAAFAAAALLATPALAADCGGSHAVDRCMVGTWQMTKNGMQEWMRKHVRKFSVTSVHATNNTITLHADGTFATGASTATVEGHGSSGMHGSATMSGQSSGTWSAADGKFNLCARPGNIDTTLTTSGGGNTTTSHAQTALPALSTQSYACAGDAFTTTREMRGDTITSIYSKVK
ncbi:MAG: hypothetical protein GC190_15480 [Alphaproteobacteria bacterium]|nr:hypothetical protein [Alphaproteobacteria bacterium]